MNKEEIIKETKGLGQYIYENTEGVSYEAAMHIGAELVCIGYRRQSETVKEFVKKLKDHFNNLEYNANTKRKTVSVDELREQMDWILHTVAIQSIEDIEREMLEEI